MRPPRNNAHVSLNVQKRCMQESFRGFRFSAGQNAWFGTLQPTEKSPEYLVKVSYQDYSAPKVEVVSPQLRPNPKHTFADGSLCLFYQDDQAWDGKNLLSKTVLLWAAEWLYCYEIWLASGEWIGPEAPHSNIKPTP